MDESFGGGIVAAKRKSGIAPYVALLVALIIFVPPLREAVGELLAPLVDMLPWRG
ncbi:hypothetical protein SUDANB95_03189 [Actinosynnema sp. ALI-1.44]